MTRSQTRARTDEIAAPVDARPPPKIARTQTRNSATLATLAPAAAQPHAAAAVPATVVGSPIQARPAHAVPAASVPSVLGRSAQPAPGIIPGVGAVVRSPSLSPVPAFAVPRPRAPAGPSPLATPQQMMPPLRQPAPNPPIASGRAVQAGGALVRLYVSGTGPAGSANPSPSISEVEAFFLPCMRSNASRVWRIQLHRDCVFVSVEPEDKEACMARAGATLGGTEVGVSVATPQQMAAAAAGRATKKAARPPGVEKERRSYRDGLSYRCGKCGAPKKGHKCHLDDDGNLIAGADADGPPLAHAVLENCDENGLPLSSGSDNDSTPPNHATAGGASRRKRAAAAATDQTVFEDMVSALGKDGEAAGADVSPPKAKLSEMDLMLADLAFAARPPPVITPDETGSNTESVGSGGLGGGIASISPSAFSPGEMFKMMATPTPGVAGAGAGTASSASKSPEKTSSQASPAGGSPP